ncbi:hypothetical protein [Amycolatopsis sp. NPDC051903]|uniref:hypothetical protein n=1 Tax=Amycolatopsis sp. NPDC051903 TaxID=3363936 RepID=UPI0037A2144A
MTTTDPLPETAPQEQAEPDRLYADFAAAHQNPLWTPHEGLPPQGKTFERSTPGGAEPPGYPTGNSALTGELRTTCVAGG